MIVKEGHLVLENIMQDILKIFHKHMCQRGQLMFLLQSCQLCVGQQLSDQTWEGAQTCIRMYF